MSFLVAKPDNVLCKVWVLGQQAHVGAGIGAPKARAGAVPLGQSVLHSAALNQPGELLARIAS